MFLCKEEQFLFTVPRFYNFELYILKANALTYISVSCNLTLALPCSKWGITKKNYAGQAGGIYISSAALRGSILVIGLTK